MDGPDNIYLSNTTHPDNIRVIDQLTAPRNWDFVQFKNVVGALAKTQRYIPSYNRPDSIHIQDFRPKLDHLYKLAKQYDAEVAQPIFMDIGTDKFIYGRITKGTKSSVRVDTKRQSGRELFQKLVLPVHIHPEDYPQSLAGGLGLSGQDYISTLSNREQLGTLMRVGGTLFLSLKTSVTPNNMDSASVKRQIEQIEKETITRSKKLMPIEKLIDFNKGVSTEFGLILLMATHKQRDLLERVPVAV